MTLARQLILCFLLLTRLTTGISAETEGVSGSLEAMRTNLKLTELFILL